jgi:hypothetical protein
MNRKSIMAETFSGPQHHPTRNERGKEDKFATFAAPGIVIGKILIGLGMAPQNHENRASRAPLGMTGTGLA